MMVRNEFDRLFISKVPHSSIFMGLHGVWAGSSVAKYVGEYNHGLLLSP